MRDWWNKFSCRIGWHNGKLKSSSSDPRGFQMYARCSKCGSEVMQDSQGNWF